VGSRDGSPTWNTNIAGNAAEVLKEPDAGEVEIDGMTEDIETQILEAMNDVLLDIPFAAGSCHCRSRSVMSAVSHRIAVLVASETGRLSVNDGQGRRCSYAESMSSYDDCVVSSIGHSPSEHAERERCKKLRKTALLVRRGRTR
jgi:hypothetical protein